MASAKRRATNPPGGSRLPKRRSRRIAESNTKEVASRATSPLPPTSTAPPCEDAPPRGLHSSSAVADELGIVQEDVCFGVLLLQATCIFKSWDKLPDNFPVQIVCIENRLMLTCEGSGKTAGLSISTPLAQVFRQHSVTLAASLGPAVKTGKVIFQGVQTRPLRVVVYGLQSEGDAVADILADGGLFLQRPEVSEYNVRVKYHNPMYLLRPGEEMPRAVGASGGAVAARGKSPNVPDEDQLGELDKSQVFRIFDEDAAQASIHDLKPIEVKHSPRIVSELKDHQLKALAMMVEREAGDYIEASGFPKLWKVSKKWSEKEGKTIYRHIVTGAKQDTPPPSLHGGVLADEMGLGKTLSTLALICHHLDEICQPRPAHLPRLLRSTLVVTTKSTIHGWQQQIHKHIRPGGINLLLYHGPKRHDLAATLHDYDVVLTTYDTLRSDWATYGPLYNKNWARIILDEAHKIRNRSSQLFLAATVLPALNRWCLTGTPIQNTLDDYGALLAFIGVPPFTTRDQFHFWVSAPVLARRKDALSALRKLVRATCLRRTKAHPALASQLRLSKKTEQVERLELGKGEREMYDFFKRRFYLLASAKAEAESDASKKPTKKRAHLQPPKRTGKPATGNPRRNRTGNIIMLISVLRMICDHGEALLPETAREVWQKRDTGQSLSWEMLQTAAGAARRCYVCGRGEDVEVAETRVGGYVDLPCKVHMMCELCAAGGDGESEEERELRCPKCPARAGKVQSPSPTLADGGESSKVEALLENVLRTVKKEGKKGKTSTPVKSVIFSNWTRMLDQIARALGPHLSSMNLSSVRIDGSSSLQQRQNALEELNTNSRCVIMLASIGAVSEGVDLTAASHVHLVEPHWNPMIEAQAVDRVHRIGQTKEVTITRYCVKDSIEEYIQWVQEDKLKIISESMSSTEEDKDGQSNADEKLQEERWKKLMDFLS